MHGFTPHCQIVAVGYQLNGGTHVHANSPFADHKLNWKVAILVQPCTAGKGYDKKSLVDVQFIRDLGFIQTAIIRNKQDMSQNHFIPSWKTTKWIPSRSTHNLASHEKGD